MQREGPPKNGKPRTVPIPASLVPILREVIGNRGGNELVFHTARKQSLRANDWRVRKVNDLRIKRAPPSSDDLFSCVFVPRARNPCG